MPPSLHLTLESESRPEKLAALTRQLATDLRRESGIEVSNATRPAGPGERSGEVNGRWLGTTGVSANLAAELWIGAVVGSEVRYEYLRASLRD